MIVALDVGLKRIGVAVSPDKKLSLPSEPIIRKNRNQAANDTLKMLEAKNADILVVGLPKGGSSEDEMERRIKHFVSLINFTGKIYYQDESFSSLEANEFVSDKKKSGRLDSVAASIILERFLSSKIV